MQNLSIENLSRVIENGDASGLMGAGTASEARVSREMVHQGMPLPQSGGSGTTFADLLTRSIEETNQQQVDADRAIKELISGRTKNIHETMLAIERADMSLKLMMQVRNKILDAYREVMRMQV